jgi:HK97 family phage major capsid protein
MVEFATVGNVTKGFQAAKERMDSLEQNALVAVKELGEVIRNLEKQVRLMRHVSLQTAAEGGGARNRFWETDEQAKQFGEMFLAVLGRKDKAMSTLVSSEGGVLVPDELLGRIIDKLGVYGKFRANALFVPMNTPKAKVPRVTGDLTVYAPGEGATIDTSDMAFDQVGLDVIKLACLTAVSSELSEDAIIGVGEIVGISITRSMAKKEDLIGFLGDGTETYFGMTGIIGALMKVSDTISQIKSLVVATGNAYSEITLGDFRKVVGILPEDADENAKWYMNKKFYYNVVYPLAEAAGVASIFEILSNQKGRFLLGYPVEFVSCMPYVEANSQICAILGDLSMGAYLGQRRGLTIEQSRDVYFANDQIGIRGIERVDVCAFGVGDTEEAGPICALITKDS